jgi:hypothetical protein
MSTTLFFLVPIGMLAVAWSLCFVGCGLHTHGLETPYSDNIVTAPNLVAYWTLSDLLGAGGTPGTLNMPGQTAGAGDLSGNNHNGAYTIPPDYPSVQFSKPIAGSSLTRTASIVPNDSGSTKNPFPASVDFEGGFVSIPWNTPNSTPADLTSFTFEAWIKPNFSAADLTAMFRWVVFSSLGNDAKSGFVIFIDEKNNWNVTLGNGSASPMLNPMVPADPNSETYLAVTFDNDTQTISLWINPESDTPSIPPAPVFSTTTTYVKVDPTQPVTFFIGAGANNDAQNPRTVNGGPGAPLLPFQGQIQSVALYSAALDGLTLQSHFEDGTA